MNIPRVAPFQLPNRDALLQGLSGVINATGVNQVLPGGGLQNFASTLQQDPRAAGQQYADWRGPFIGEADQMAVPMAPWGTPTGITMRTAPARTMQANLKRQAMLDMYRDAQKSIDQAPTSSFMETTINNAVKELNMRRMGLGRDQLYDKTITRKGRETAYMDQVNEAWTGLNSLFPEASAVDSMPPQLQGTLRTLLTNAREQVTSRMAQQKQNTGRPIREGGTAADVVENHRGYITRALDQSSEKMRAVGDEGIADELNLQGNFVRYGHPATPMNRQMMGHQGLRTWQGRTRKK